MGDTRQRIVNATTVLLQQRGYAATSVKDITAAAPATVGSVYHFFPGGKAELVAAVIDESGAAYRELFEVITSEVDDPADAIAHFFAGAADALEESGFVDICPIGTLAAEVASSDEALRQATQRAFASWETAVTAKLVGGGLTGADAASLATTVIALIEGSFVLARSRRNADLVRRAGQHAKALIGAAQLAANRSTPLPSGSLTVA